MKTKIIPHLSINSIDTLKRHKIAFNEVTKNVFGCEEIIKNNKPYRKQLYQYTENNKHIITNLLYYFSGTEKEYNLNKGIMLAGHVGTGKTLLIKLMQAFCHMTTNPNMFRTESMETLKDYWKKKHNLDYFNALQHSRKKGINLCINEFGFHYDEKLYGVNFSEYFHSFFMLRYELFKSNNLITHTTTNLTTQELKDIYDPTIYDRIKEMFNVIPLHGNSFRE